MQRDVGLSSLGIGMILNDAFVIFDKANLDTLVTCLQLTVTVLGRLDL